MKSWKKRSKQRTTQLEGKSFYFFDFDDNIMFLSTPIFIRNKDTQEVKAVSTTDFATIHPQLGKIPPYEQYETYEGTYKNFSDISEGELKAGQKQYFVDDIEKAVDQGGVSWQAPSWKLFALTCENQLPVSIITARGHSPETIKAGIRVLVDKELVSQEPNYISIFPVGNNDVRINQLADPNLELSTSELKRIAIKVSVDQAIKQYGVEADHRFGMSDDDPKNVNLIIKAMCECKKKYLDKRFFVIDTHEGEMVKLEVFPFDYPVTRHVESDFVEPLD